MAAVTETETPAGIASPNQAVDAHVGARSGGATVSPPIGNEGTGIEGRLFPPGCGVSGPLPSVGGLLAGSESAPSTGGLVENPAAGELCCGAASTPEGPPHPIDRTARMPAKEL
jgi:hypothetical protein